MRVAILFGPMCLSFRKSFDFDTLWTDSRGLTGSEIGFVRIAQCMRDLGHEVTIFTDATQDEWDGMRVSPLCQAPLFPQFDAAVAINEPDTLRNINAKFKVCEFWLNDVTFCRAGFEDHVDLFVSPSKSHLEQVLANPEWHVVGVTGQHPNGEATYAPDAAKWKVIELGCDPERYEIKERCTLCNESDGRGPPCANCGGALFMPLHKVPGRVVYCSSPDRGLHLLLQEWPRIKRAVPHAHLRIFYRLEPWLRGFDNLGYHPPIEPLRARALYIEESLRRMQGPEWGIEVLDSVSREQIEREMCEAEVLAYPCATTRWSEGFSCTILEACAARACPIITDCDGLPSVYGEALSLCSVNDPAYWRGCVIHALQDANHRERVNNNAHALASRLTWKNHTKRLESAILEQLQPEKPSVTTIAHHPV